MPESNKLKSKSLLKPGNLVKVDLENFYLVKDDFSSSKNSGVFFVNQSNVINSKNRKRIQNIFGKLPLVLVVEVHPAEIFCKILLGDYNYWISCAAIISQQQKY